jgi:hypothetical protein
METVSSLQGTATSRPNRGQLVSLNDAHAPLQHSLSETWDGHAFPFLLSKFQGKFAESVYHVVASVVSHAEDGSALYKVCSAVGLAYLANMTRSSTALADREWAYGAAISAVNLDLQDPRQWTSDRTLLSVWLLGQCEVCYNISDLWCGAS